MRWCGLVLSAVLLGACATPQAPGNDVCRNQAECAGRVKTAVERAWRRPAGECLRGLSAELRVTLGEEFEVQSVVVKRSSGNAAFDSSAVEAVGTAAQFPQLKGLSRRDAERFRELEFRFRPPLE